MTYDFSGYATKNDLKCGDGRIIRKDAFKDNDGAVVPLVWNHMHDDPENVLGHALLENREDGVYCYGSFNESEKAKSAKELIAHGDISAMSIMANRLVQKGSDVVHGVIREVSLVLAGANPGAFIDNLNITHSDGSEEILADEAIIYSDNPINTKPISHSEIENEEVDDESEDDETLEHAEENQNGTDSDEEDDETLGEIYESMNPEQKAVTDYIVGLALEGKLGEEFDSEEISHSDDEEGPTLEEVFKTMTDKQKNLVYYLTAKAVEDSEDDESEDDETMEQSDLGDDESMKHNVFDAGTDPKEETISHSEIEAAINDAKRMGSMKDAFLEHGITELEVLFPEAKLVTPTPEMIARPMDWVSVTWNALKKSPFARIKSTAANVTADEARARGYQKGKKKIEEVLTLLKRVTTPQTVYKLQKMDRDDIIDITDIDVIAWLKSEMRMMLDEELARAVLIGDGRTGADESKIRTENIRPIYGDDPLYTIYKEVTVPSDENDMADTIIDAVLKARKDYMGSGSPWMFASTDVINSMLLAKDKIGRRLYANINELADVLRVSKIVEVPLFEGQTRHVDANQYGSGQPEAAADYDLLALVVNPADYMVGSDRQGAVTLFDDFDIDYNKYEYLIETRCSGALVKPYSAIALEAKKA